MEFIQLATSFQPHRPAPGGRPSRWDNLDSDPRPFRSYQSRRLPSVNRLGFHGSMNPSRIIEKDLFDISDHVTEGINFDNVASRARPQP